MESSAMEELRQVIVWSCVASGFVGGMVGQLIAGAYFLKNIVSTHCKREHASLVERKVV